MGVRWSRMSWNEKNELWQRWRRGETLDSGLTHTNRPLENPVRFIPSMPTSGVSLAPTPA